MEKEVFNPLKLENQLCFPLYAASREVIKAYTPLLSKLDITYTQYVVMMVLWEDKKISVKDLGIKLFLDSGTLTPLLKSLETKGLVTRTRCKEDERVLIVEITKKGEDLRNDALSVPYGLVSCVSLTKDEAIELHSLLYKLLDNFKK